MFPFLGVRFIAINEHFDSNNYKGRTVGIDVGLKALIHQLYSQDLSCKSTSARISKQKEGYYLSAIPPYGYMKTNKGKSKLTHNPETAPTVERIFKLAIEGKKPTEIARIFNDEEILTPNQYRMSKNIFTATANATDTIQPRWIYLIVRKILMNEVYYGTLISRKNIPLKVGTKKSRKANDDELVICDNAHAPIVSKADWDKAQGVFSKMKTKKKTPNSTTKSQLNRLLKCGCCGRSLENNNYYRCTSHISSSNTDCKYVGIREDDMIEILLKEIELRYPNRVTNSTIQHQTELDGNEKFVIENKLKLINRKKQLLFENLAEEKIDSHVFKEETEQLHKEQTKLLERSQELLEISCSIATTETKKPIEEDIESLFKTYIDYVAMFPNQDYKIFWK